MYGKLNSTRNFFSLTKDLPGGRQSGSWRCTLAKLRSRPSCFRNVQNPQACYFSEEPTIHVFGTDSVRRK